MHLSSSRAVILATVMVVVSLATGSAPAYAASKPGAGQTSTPVGNDVSYPNCTGTLPSKQAFAIVGVNDGLANNTNPCLAKELAWANTSTGTTVQPKSALYVNTANPSGVAGIAWWPTSNTFYDTTGTDSNSSGPGAVTVTVPVPTTYGTCSPAGSNDVACAYVYGWAKAYDDVHYRNVPARDPSGTAWMWWLDVETANSWETTNLAANQADLEAMAAYFKSTGATVGLYSTSVQWNQITGNPPDTTLVSLPNWVPGARTLTGAISNCGLKGFTPNSPVTVTQYVSKIDYDYACKTA